jgi:hypothetical protein
MVNISLTHLPQPPSCRQLFIDCTAAKFQPLCFSSHSFFVAGLTTLISQPDATQSFGPPGA